ncbi:MAG: hypothetical protein HY721_13585 [Planctomycetes bacterium]|nr:hypothetical protein [Planctomycetota bacterium]
MKEPTVDSVTCLEVQDALREDWAGAPGQRLEGAEPLPVAVTFHIEGCMTCRGMAEEIRRLDRELGSSLEALASGIEAPSQERIDDTLRRLSEEDPAARLLRKLKRPLRLVLWGTLYAFTLLLCSVLAVALYKAILTQGR